jgi:hypothetical protein
VAQFMGIFLHIPGGAEEKKEAPHCRQSALQARFERDYT